MLFSSLLYASAVASIPISTHLESRGIVEILANPLGPFSTWKLHFFRKGSRSFDDFATAGNAETRVGFNQQVLDVSQKLDMENADFDRRLKRRSNDAENMAQNVKNVLYYPAYGVWFKQAGKGVDPKEVENYDILETQME